MLLGGTDVCGDDEHGQHRIIAIVMGTHDAINALRNNIHVKEIHMSKISEKARIEVMQKLDFRNNDLFALSLEVEKVKTVKEIHERNKQKDKYYDIKLPYQHFDALLLSKIRSKMEGFSYRFDSGITNIMMECDNDMYDTIRSWRMQRKSEGKAYELADAVAYCHNKRKKIRGCTTINLVKDLRKQMNKDLLIK
ncbi:MAG: hypothetical protein WD154_02605 [Nitrosopumilaceae archaeon]